MKEKTLVFLVLIILLGCNKEEGPGGFSKITGTLIEIQVNYKNQVLNTCPGATRNLYINYGNSRYYDDEIEAGYNGYFEFTNLTEGDYTVGFYSDDTSGVSSSGKIYYEYQVSLGKKETKNLDTLISFDILDIDDGTSSIAGNVTLINYYNSALPPYDVNDIKDITPAQEEDIYLIYENNEFYIERTRTNYNGYFRFDHLIKGNYRIFVYSEDLLGGIYDTTSENVIYEPSSNGTFNLVIYRDVIIDEDYQEKTVSEMIIEQE